MPTKSEIPSSTASFFQEYAFDDLDAQRHQRLVMERILAFGNRQEIRWVFANYGRPAVEEWLQEDGCYMLPKYRYRLFCTILDLPRVEHPRARKRIWPH